MGFLEAFWLNCLCKIAEFGRFHARACVKEKRRPRAWKIFKSAFCSRGWLIMNWSSLRLWSRGKEVIANKEDTSVKPLKTILAWNYRIIDISFSSNVLRYLSKIKISFMRTTFQLRAVFSSPHIILYSEWFIFSSIFLALTKLS